MTPHREAEKRYCSRAIIVAIAAGAGFILAGYPALGKGLIAGTLFSILNFILIGRSLQHRLGRERAKASLVSLGWILLRYGLMAVPLILALEYRLFHPVTAAVGLFAVQLVILGEQVVVSFTSSSGSSA
jgi:hypothetical protein